MGILRVLLALAVVLVHARPGFRMVGGDIAVEAFFMISGFYMALVLNEKYIGQAGSYKLFISNRFLRLFPQYWMVLIVSVVVSAVFLRLYGPGHAFKFDAYAQVDWNLSPSTWAALIFTNLFVFGQDVIMFTGLNNATGNLYLTSDFTQSNPQTWTFLPVGQAWTLSIELCFYLIAPFLVRRKVPVLLALMGISLAIRLALAYAGYSKDPFNYRFFPSELIFFLAGAVAYHVYLRYKKVELNPLLMRGVLAGLVLYTVFYQYLPFPTLGKQVLYYVLFAAALPFVFIFTKRSKLDSAIGELSYPIYIVHLVVLFIVEQVLFKLHAPEWLEIPADVIVCLIAAAFLVRFVADPIERIRQRRVAKQKQLVPVA